MLNFKDELLKYQPILELEDIHNSLKPSQLKDLIDILENIATDRDQKTNKNHSRTKKSEKNSKTES